MLIGGEREFSDLYPLFTRPTVGLPPSSLVRRLCSHLRVSNREPPWGPFSSVLPYTTLSRRCTEQFMCSTLMMELWVEVWRSFMIWALWRDQHWIWGCTSIMTSRSWSVLTLPPEMPCYPLLSVSFQLILMMPPFWASGSADGVDSTIRIKKEVLEVLGGRLQHLYAHDALCLLRHVFSLPKMLYTLRTSPCFLSPELELFDQLQRKLLGSITNIDLFVSDRAWTQASLPVWSGHLGIRSVAQLSNSAFFGLCCWVFWPLPPTSPPYVQRSLSWTERDPQRLECWSAGRTFISHSLHRPEGMGDTHS